MANVNELKLNNVTHKLNDDRLSSGTAKKTSGGYTGDIYLYTCPETVTTSNGWKYFTEPSGLTICYKTITGSVDPSVSWGTSQESVDYLLSDRNLPVTFKSKPIINIFINSPWAHLYTGAGQAASTTTTMGASLLTIATNASGWGSRSYRIEIIAIGQV